MVEALTADVPVVSTDVGGIAELRGEAIRVAAVGDDAALAMHVLDGLEDPATLAAGVAEATRTAERFAPAACHSAYARLYARLLTGSC